MPVNEIDSQKQGIVVAVAALPKTYAEWKHCIEVDCGIPLTTSFCERRIQALDDEQDRHTQAFRDKYGEEHLAQVISWFRTALDSDAVAAD